MTDTKHSKLPWKVDIYDIINSDGDKVVGDVYGRSENDCIVQAKLIVDSVNNIQQYREALENIAKQHLTDELLDDEIEDADFKGAYDIMIEKARNALNKES